MSLVLSVRIHDESVKYASHLVLVFSDLFALRVSCVGECVDGPR